MRRHHHPPRDLSGVRGTVVVADQLQTQVDPAPRSRRWWRCHRGRCRARPDPPVRRGTGAEAGRRTASAWSPGGRPATPSRPARSHPSRCSPVARRGDAPAATHARPRRTDRFSIGSQPGTTIVSARSSARSPDRTTMAKPSVVSIEPGRSVHTLNRYRSARNTAAAQPSSKLACGPVTSATTRCVCMAQKYLTTTIQTLWESLWTTDARDMQTVRIGTPSTPHPRPRTLPRHQAALALERPDRTRPRAGDGPRHAAGRASTSTSPAPRRCTWSTASSTTGPATTRPAPSSTARPGRHTSRRPPRAAPCSSSTPRAESRRATRGRSAGQAGCRRRPSP